MRKMILKIGFIMVSFVIFSSNVYATQENIVNNTVSNDTLAEKVQEEVPTETPRNDVMYVQERCNIRKSYSVDSDRVGGLDVGTEVTVVAEYSNGWYKIQYDGGEAYIKAGILKSTKPEGMEDEAETEENQDEVDNEYAELINEIGVLPEVGHNVADILYGAVLVIAIAVLIFVKYKV